jgi:O-antigen ligase
VQYRFLMWRDAVRLVRDHPFLGIGMESLKSHWQEWHIQAYEKFPLHSHFHSSPIQIAVERGLLTLAAWLWLLAGYSQVLVRLLRTTGKRDWRLHGLALGMASATCAFLLGSLTDYNWGDSEVVMVFWMFVGWTLALERLLTPVKEGAGIAAVG